MCTEILHQKITRKAHLQRQVWRAFCQPHLVLQLWLWPSTQPARKVGLAIQTNFFITTCREEQFPVLRHCNTHLVQEDYTSAIILGVLPGANPRLQCQVWNCFSAHLKKLLNFHVVLSKRNGRTSKCESDSSHASSNLLASAKRPSMSCHKSCNHTLILQNVRYEAYRIIE